METPRLPQKGEIWFRHAHVQTDGWETLPGSENILITSTDAEGAWQEKPSPISKDAFSKYFFEIKPNLWQQRIRISEVSYEQKACWVIFLDPQDREINQEAKHHSFRIIQKDFQPEK